MTLHGMTHLVWVSSGTEAPQARCECGWTGPVRDWTTQAWTDYYEHLYEAEREAGGFEDSPEAA